MVGYCFYSLLWWFLLYHFLLDTLLIEIVVIGCDWKIYIVVFCCRMVGKEMENIQSGTCEKNCFFSQRDCVFICGGDATLSCYSRNIFRCWPVYIWRTSYCVENARQNGNLYT